jgi:hypothetical protein
MIILVNYLVNIIKHTQTKYSYLRGFTLLVAIIFSSVVLTVGLSLLDIFYKETLLASTVKESQNAFYNAESLMECALYNDQKLAAFDYTSPDPNISCSGILIPLLDTGTNQPALNTTTRIGNTRITTFPVECALGGTLGIVTIYKVENGTLPTCAPGKETCMYAKGYSSCDSSDPRRVERGVKVLY